MNINVNSNTGIYDLNSGMNTQAVTETATQQKMASVPADEVHYVKAGDTLSGQIIGMNDDGTVELLLGDNTHLNAFLSKNMGLTMGQTLSFTVSGASDSKISLTPLYANLDGNSAVAKALTQAGLPITKQNGDLVTSMMERGLPIDARSLQGMAANSARFPLADPKSIVQMTELNIPLTEENIKEFEAYKTNQYKIADSLDELTRGFTDIAGESLKSNKEITDLFLNNPDDPKINLNELQNALEKAENGDFSKASELLNLDNNELTEINSKLTNAVLPEGEEIDPKTAEEAVIKDDPEAAKNTERKVSQDQGMKARDLNGVVTDDVHKLLGKEGAENLADKMNKAGLPEALASKVADGSISAKDTLDLTRALLEKGDKDSPEFQQAFRELIRSPEYKSLLNNGITNEFLMKPEDVADKERVKEYYEKVVKNTEKALEFLNNTGRGSSSLAQGMNNLKSNVDFMNQLNNVMTYMQLPLKMNEEKAHGDLYVYTNKKNLAKKDGNVSALLHLDMQHLGTMDIHVQMTNGENVKTHFIMQNDAVLDFIGEHLHELDEALAKRGYNMHSDVSLNKEKRDVPDIMFNRGTNEKLIQTTSFDIRA
ncbi:MAG: flagellar hook-length control protein FliK [Lachnospiraceae bacterium]|nr:flagellar hook-length control protein FliK [Lachnospiraceae bacterium]